MKKVITSLPVKGGLGLLFLVMIALSACQDKQYLRGHFDEKEFLSECKWEQKVDEMYKPKQKHMDSLATLKDSFKVRVYLGTYCHDSKKWVPRFFQLKKKLPVQSLEIISLDTTKRDDREYAKQDGIEKIPTFIFFKGGNEIGRIVEKPKGRLEKNIWKIINTEHIKAKP